MTNIKFLSDILIINNIFQKVVLSGLLYAEMIKMYIHKRIILKCCTYSIGVGLYICLHSLFNIIY